MSRIPATLRVPPSGGLLRFGVLAALGMLLAHDAIFAAGAAIGANDAQFEVLGHRYWGTFAVLVVLAAAVTTAATIAGLARLNRAVRGLPAPAPTHRGPTYVAEVMRLWPRLLLVVTAAFFVQENVEHLAAGLPLPGLWALTAPGYPFAVPALLAVTGLLAAIGAWFRHREAILVGRLCAACSAYALRHRHLAKPRWPDVGWLFTYRLLLARPDAGRAPPELAA
ncbi:MAG: hypothetical protein U0838_13465 [Chloroflexota bacterium]